MTKTQRWLTLGIAFAGVLGAAAGFTRQADRSFQLVYHSDTRGYYRPCG